MSAKSLAADMYIDELETNISDAARIMLDDGCQGRQPPQLTSWLNTVATRASYSHRRRVHIQVLELRFSPQLMPTAHVTVDDFISHVFLTFFVLL